MIVLLRILLRDCVQARIAPRRLGLTATAFAFSCILFCTAVATAAEADSQASEILSLAKHRGGVLVHLFCGDGQLTAALARSGDFVVQGLDTDSNDVQQARQRLRSSDEYGMVSADTFDGHQLPYVDNLVNVLVAESLGTVAQQEAMRVLVPGGILCLKENGRWSAVEKPRSADMDEWTHYLHDPTNNAVADDRLVGPPRHVQWIGTPEYLRHHDHMSGLSAMVSAGGRLFAIIDLGPRWSVEMPPQWTLVARDAFNGAVLWQRAIGKWHPHLWPLKKGPADLMRRLVAVDDRVYVTLAVGGPVEVLDAATGERVSVISGTEGAEEILVESGTLYALVNPQRDAYRTIPSDTVEAIRGAGREWNWDERPRQIVAVNLETREHRWKHDSRVAPVTLALARGNVYFYDGQRVCCLDARDGSMQWRSEPLPCWNPMHVLFAPTLVVYQDVLVFAGGEKMTPTRGGEDTMTALSADTGKILWSAPHPPSGYASAEDVLIIDDLVWCGATTNRRDSGVFTGRDLHTGEVVREFPPDDWQPHMPHHRCYRAKATCNYILTSRTGIELVDVRAKHWNANHWVRGSCNYGIMPCNGLIYAPPHSCACYLLAKLTGFQALASRRSESLTARIAAAAGRWTRGPALERPVSEKETKTTVAPWPTYRGNVARGGASSSPLGPNLKHAWEASIAERGRLSAPVMAGGQVLVAAVDEHAVVALDKRTGEELWRFQAGGRVDSPPTVWKDLAIFGSADGFVYAVSCSDGLLAWKFRAAPADVRTMAREQIESLWPVHGSVLVVGDVVYCVAGRSMWLDGGLRMIRLDAATGRVLSETVLDDKYPGTDKNLQEGIQWPNLPVALPDVLSYDGRFIYMRSQPFTLDGRRPEIVTPRDYAEQQGETAHLFSPTGFLDDSWWHRTYWMYGRSYVSGAGGWDLATYRAPAGRILVVDGDMIYGFGRVPGAYRGTPNRYQLFASAKFPEIQRVGGKLPVGARPSRVPLSRPRYEWAEGVPMMVRSLVAGRDVLFATGPPMVLDEAELYVRYGGPESQRLMDEQVAAFSGERGAVLMALSKSDGSKLAAYRLASAPVFGGAALGNDRLVMATLDRKIICLSPSGAESLEAADDVEPGPVPDRSPPIPVTKSHPDFQHLSDVQVTGSDLGYRLRARTAEGGLALKHFESGLPRQVTFHVKIRPRPGSPPGTPGNGFLVFGDSTDPDQLVRCGFRISGQRLYVLQGSFAEGQSKSVPVKVQANEEVELRVVVDLDRQTVRATMSGATVTARLQEPLNRITWLGYCVASVDADFGQIRIEPVNENGRR